MATGAVTDDGRGGRGCAIVATKMEHTVHDNIKK
jgi:hypothetical protein